MRKDFEDYLLRLQKQENEMSRAAEEANELLKDGKISAVQAHQIQECMNIIHSNYQRVMYCKYLYTLPPKFIQKFIQKRLDKKAKKFLEESADKESVIVENNEAIQNIADIKSEAYEEI